MHEEVDDAGDEDVDRRRADVTGAEPPLANGAYCFVVEAIRVERTHHADGIGHTVASHDHLEDDRALQPPRERVRRVGRRDPLHENGRDDAAARTIDAAALPGLFARSIASATS